MKDKLIQDFKIQGKCESCGFEYIGNINKNYPVLCPKCSEITKDFKPFVKPADGVSFTDSQFFQVNDKYSNDACKNANFVEDKYFRWSNEGCKNLKANGSSRCQECSDKYKN